LEDFMKNPCAIALVVLAASCWPAAAQHAPDASARIAAQKDALARLAALDGTWRGEAWTLLPNGEKHTITQTERVGPFLDGAVRVIEGRGFDAAGQVVFNAFAIASFDPDRRAYSLRSYAQGRSGDFTLTPTADGFTWEIPAGPATIRYTATVKDGTWHEVGDRIVGTGAPVRFMEMTLKRVGDTDWPSGGAVAPKP
jgi:hypothetical protein